jgi:hypothetical protein
VRWPWRRRRERRPDVDAWAPPLGAGYWRTLFGECCDALLAYDRLVATMPTGELGPRLVELRRALVSVLDRARHLAELGAGLEPAGPGRDPWLLALLAEDPVADLGTTLGEPGTGPLADGLVALRQQLREVADEAARLVLRVRENPTATDVVGWLDGLAKGIASARHAGWTPIGYE